MGTSKSFSDTRKAMIPNWNNLSSIVTSSCSSSVSTDDKKKILKNYVTTLGGASKAGRGGSKIGGKSGIKNAIKIGAFLSAFSNSGNDIREALKEVGLPDLTGKSVSDIINHLIEYCSGTASTIDEVAAKEATRQVLEDLISEANDFDELEKVLAARFDSETYEDIIIRYFGYYIYEHLDKWFYEKLIKDKNQSDCNNLFKEIKDFIFEKMKGMQRRNNLQDLDWSSENADVLVKNIQQDILTVFE
ncbi:hypothetical protein [Tenacibaculum larymnensis]|uniref:Uncharacterized protein n=1 Tax=Tenacibaculum larymnensis TaxID=2878201 RepID=A0A9X4EP59_9FLAO|nr:hypothetical protein [Tenacibaculum larymnensis]MDE1206015.1 hypothetical protein [Tenacibaculum larymnensis]